MSEEFKVINEAPRESFERRYRHLITLAFGLGAGFVFGMVRYNKPAAPLKVIEKPCPAVLPPQCFTLTSEDEGCGGPFYIQIKDPTGNVIADFQGPGTDDTNDALAYAKKHGLKLCGIEDTAK